MGQHPQDKRLTTGTVFGIIMLMILKNKQITFCELMLHNSYTNELCVTCAMDILFEQHNHDVYICHHSFSQSNIYVV